MEPNETTDPTNEAIMSTVVSVRMSDHERDLLEDAATEADSSLSDFIRRNALIAAQDVLLERRSIEIPADKWAEIEALMAAPAEDLPPVRELAELAAPCPQ